jgi:glycosyltransferase involved in cell wall biosynthesis
MDENTKITVIVPLFNKAETIKRSLLSIFAQKKQADEIIIINDGSTDDSLSIVQSIKDDKIKIINQVNKGVSAARNAGIQEARNRMLTFLDADDEWLPDYLLTITDLIRRYPNAVGYATAYTLKYDNDSLRQIVLRNLPFTTADGLLTNYFDVANHSNPPIWTGAVCVKKNLLDKINGFPVGVKAGEDLLTWARLSQFGHFAYSTSSLAIYYQPNFSRQFPLPPDDDFVGHELFTLIKSTQEKSRKRDIKIYLSNWYKMRAALFLITGKSSKALREVGRSFVFNPYNFKSILFFILFFFPVKCRYNLLFNREKFRIKKNK